MNDAQVRLAHARVERLTIMHYWWVVTFYLPGDPHKHEWQGFTQTKAGGWRRIARAMAGSLVSGRRGISGQAMGFKTR